MRWLGSLSTPTMVEIQKRTIAQQLNSISVGLPAFVADLGVREEFVYRRVWAGIACVQNDVTTVLSSQPRWVTRIEITDDLGQMMEWLKWGTYYQFPGDVWDPSRQNEQLMGWQPPCIVTGELGDPDKASLAHAGNDSRSFVFPEVQGRMHRVTCCPMSLTGRIRRITMKIENQNDSVDEPLYLIGGLMIQSQALPFT